MSEEIQYVASLLPNRGLAVDVGAYHGEISKELLNLKFSVVAIEPNERLFHILRREIPQAKILTLAASDRNGKAELIISRYEGVSSLELDWCRIVFPDEFEGKSAIVDTWRLENIFSSADDIAFLKIDAEGHDDKVLEGLGDLKPRVIMFEVNGKLMVPGLRALLILNSLGYTDFRMFVRYSDKLLAVLKNFSFDFPKSWYQFCKEQDVFANVVCHL